MKAMQMIRTQDPLVVVDIEEEPPGVNQVKVKVSGCGVCHTDIGFWKNGVPTRHKLPLTLGHEISGVVMETGPGAEAFAGKEVLVPAVIPCGQCDLCRQGRGNVCAHQIMPGNDIHGGFAEFVTIPITGLCVIEEKGDYSLEELSVVADAVTTPYQAVVRSALKTGELAIVVGTGGVGGYCVQIAVAKGAKVVAIDVNDKALEAMASCGAGLILNSSVNDFKQIKQAIKSFAEESGCPDHSWKIFECSGHPAGQSIAYGLVGRAATLMVVGFTLEKVPLRLSNLMAFDAAVQGTWGCRTELYPEALALVTGGRVSLKGFIRSEPMSAGPDLIEAVSRHEVAERVILVPDWN